MNIKKAKIAFGIVGAGTVLAVLTIMMMQNQKKPAPLVTDSAAAPITCESFKTLSVDDAFFATIQTHSKRLIASDVTVQDWKNFETWLQPIHDCLDGVYAEAVTGIWANSIANGFNGFYEYYKVAPEKQYLLDYFAIVYRDQGINTIEPGIGDALREQIQAKGCPPEFQSVCGN